MFSATLYSIMQQTEGTVNGLNIGKNNFAGSYILRESVITVGYQRGRSITKTFYTQVDELKI